MKKRFLLMVFVVAMMTFAPTTVSAGRRFYSDVTLKTAGDTARYNAIWYGWERNIWCNIANDGGKFRPNKGVSPGDFYTVLLSMYDKSKIPWSAQALSNAWKASYSQESWRVWRSLGIKEDVISSKFACSRFAELGTSLGLDITWNGYSDVPMTRKDLALYIRKFVAVSGKFAITQKNPVTEKKTTKKTTKRTTKKSTKKSKAAKKKAAKKRALIKLLKEVLNDL